VVVACLPGSLLFQALKDDAGGSVQCFSLDESLGCYCMTSSLQKSLRILAVAQTWQGSNSYAYVRAFQRMGHSVMLMAPESFVPLWRRKYLRAVRHLLEPALVQEYTDALVTEARHLQPHLFFVFKGIYVTAKAIRAIRDTGAVAINFFPDIGILAHGKYIPEALPHYDWVFTTKSFGAGDMERLLGIYNVSFLPHSFDPEVHVTVALDDNDHTRYDCDVSFIGTWSPKKQKLLERVHKEFPGVRFRIWGAQWESARHSLSERIEGRGVVGIEYAKALIASKINLAILREVQVGASSGDQITSRTFHIPATGAFMLHERTGEFLQYFEEGKECACFETPNELRDKIAYYLDHEKERLAMAASGRQRSIQSGYSVDCRANEILAKIAEIRAAKFRANSA
jgi:spore maturation protein CgeB